jgi:hypothetical protein
MPFTLWVAGWLALFLLLVLRPKKISQVAAALVALLLVVWSFCGIFYTF